MQRHENKKAEHAAWTIPLSENQKRFYFEEQLHAGTGVYHTAGAFEILGALDRQAFRKACRMAFERYAFLRARVDREGLCWQWSSSQEDVFDRCYQEVDASQESLDSLQEDWLSTRFCLEEGRLWDWRLFRLCRDKHIFGMLQHHMVMDGSSWRTLAGYISTYYNGLVREQPCEPPPTLAQALSLSESCYQAEKEALERTRGTSAAFWRQTLEEAPWSVALPSWTHHEDRQDLSAQQLSFAFNKEKAAALRAYTKEQRTTLFLVLGAVYGQLLCKHSNASK